MAPPTSRSPRRSSASISRSSSAPPVRQVDARRPGNRRDRSPHGAQRRFGPTARVRRARADAARARGPGTKLAPTRSPPHGGRIASRTGKGNSWPDDRPCPARRVESSTAPLRRWGARRGKGPLHGARRSLAVRGTRVRRRERTAPTSSSRLRADLGRHPDEERRRYRVRREAILTAIVSSSPAGRPANELPTELSGRVSLHGSSSGQERIARRLP